jgi:ribosomal protein S18 acetylase RimI-like enzyme
VVEIRRAARNDASEIAEVCLRSRAASIPAIPPPVHSDDEVRAWFSDVVVPTKEVWVAEIDGTLVALLVLEDDWIDQLYVHPDHTRMGLGERLVDLAKQRRPRRLQLWTFQANHGARRFYERHGFVEMEGTAGDNEERAPDVRYEWQPSEAEAAPEPNPPGS